MADISCDTCANNVYDDDFESYVCQINMDEDEYYRFVESERRQCPYYAPDDDYFLARKQ